MTQRAATGSEVVGTGAPRAHSRSGQAARPTVGEHAPPHDHLVEFWRRTARIHPSLPAPPVASVASKFRLEDGVTTVLSARDGAGGILGVNTMRVVDNGRAAPTGSIFGSNLLVHTSFRGGTLAGQLMEQLFSRAVILGTDRLLALVDPRNERAFRLYRYFGFGFASPAMAECNDILLESYWPLAVRFLVDGIGPDLPNWPDPSWKMLARGFRPRHRERESRDDLTATTDQPEVLEYETTLPAWHRPSVSVLVERSSASVVGLRGEFMEVGLAPQNSSARCRVLGVNRSPATLRVVVSVGETSLLGTDVEAGATFSSSPMDREELRRQGWELEAFREDGRRLCRLRFPPNAVADRSDLSARVRGGELVAEVSGLDGLVRVTDRRTGRALASLSWPGLGDVSPHAPRRPPEIEGSITTLDDGSVEVAAPADTWSEIFARAGRALESQLPADTRVVRTVRPVRDGIEIEVAVEGRAGTGAGRDEPEHLGVVDRHRWVVRVGCTPLGLHPTRAVGDRRSNGAARDLPAARSQPRLRGIRHGQLPGSRGAIRVAIRGRGVGEDHMVGADVARDGATAASPRAGPDRGAPRTAHRC